MRSEFESYQLDYIIDTTITEDAKRDPNYIKLNKAKVTNIGLNLSQSIRTLIIGDGTDSARLIWQKLI